MAELNLSNIYGQRYIKDSLNYNKIQTRNSDILIINILRGRVPVLKKRPIEK